MPSAAPAARSAASRWPGRPAPSPIRAPFRDYSWFVGYAPADRPEIAVATVIANGTVWRVHAPQVAKDALEAYFATRVAEAPANGGLRTAKAPAP